MHYAIFYVMNKSPLRKQLQHLLNTEVQALGLLVSVS